ncbi:RNA-directed DNA polymerase, eukaryota, reverse transcriptase zinc-binding domain protein [Tanacetum coccineum]
MASLRTFPPSLATLEIKVYGVEYSDPLILCMRKVSSPILLFKGELIMVLQQNSVKSTREHIDHCSLPNGELKQGGIAFFQKRSISSFGGFFAIVSHLATTVWNRVLVWLDLPNLANIQDLYSWLDDLHISSNRRATLEVICGVVLWSLWNFRNETIFDDVIITTGWNARDLENIIRVLHVFYLASGLKINIHKSNIYGIGVNEDEVYNMASNAGCIAGNIPFNYLGLPIGSNMKSIASWKMLIDRFRSRLSTWKASLLSIGGRLTLIKSVLGSLGIYYLLIFRAPESVLNDLERIRSNFFWGGNQDGKKMAWVKWPIILNSYDNGGLNIGSLKAFNLALLQKWRWRLFTSPNDLWVKVVKAFHGHEGGFDNNGCSFKGTWANIVGSSNFLHSKGIILNNSFRFNAGCGTRIRFWKDIWVGEAPLSIRYNRLYRLDQDKDCLIIDRIINGQWHWNWSRTNIGVRNLAFFRDMLNEIGQLNIVASEDTCVWNLGPNGTFTVKDARNIIDQKTLPSLPSTSWDKIIPRKVNIFMWRLSLDRLPHRLNLSLRGMDIPAISCSSCNANVESANHIFFECIIASDLWKLVYRWCEIPFVQALSFEAFKDWLSSWHAPKEKKHRLFIISTSRQFVFILDGLAEVTSNDRVFGQWLNALFQKAAFLSCLLPRGLFGVSSKTTSE